MQNLYIIRTAAIASLAAAVTTLGWMGTQGEEAQFASPEPVSVAPTVPGPAVYFPAGFVLQPNQADAEPYEYY